MLAVQIRSSGCWHRRGACSRFQVRVEEGDDPAAGIVRGWLVIAGVGHPRQKASDRAGLAPGLVQEGVPASGYTRPRAWES